MQISAPFPINIKSHRYPPASPPLRGQRARDLGETRDSFARPIHFQVTRALLQYEHSIPGKKMSARRL